MPALSSHGGNLSYLLSRDLTFTFLVIMGAMGCTWLKYFSKEHGVNPWTLWLILHPGCSAVVSAVTCMYTVSHHALPAVCGCSLQSHSVHAGCPVISHTGLAAPAHRQLSLPPPRCQVLHCLLASTDQQSLQPFSKTKPPHAQNSNQGPLPTESRSQVE